MEGKPSDLIENENLIDNAEYSEELNAFSNSKFSTRASTIKYDIGILDDEYYINNDLHKHDIIVPNDKRMMSEIMTSFEYTRVISERAKMIENGSPIFCKYGNESSPIKIAEMEVMQKKCPIKIQRPLTKNIYEIWRVNEMIVPFK